jgi:hypothetical protein
MTNSKKIFSISEQLDLGIEAVPAARVPEPIAILPIFDPIAFVFALVLSPLVVAVAGCWLFFPVAAVVVGGPIYLLVGTPILLWLVTRVAPEFDRFAGVGLLANVGLFALTTLLFPFVNSPVPAGGLFIGLWGFVFAPLWAGTFAVLYRKLYRPYRLYPVM